MSREPASGRVIDVRTRPSGPDTFHLELFQAGIHIGDYERSVEHEIPRKLREIERAAEFLLSVHADHGKFVVRWNGRDRTKEVRAYQEGSGDPGRGARPLAVIPREYWTGEVARGRVTTRRRAEDAASVENPRTGIDALLDRDAVKDEINYMSGRQFEEFVADLFRRSGYSVLTTPGSGDQGVDLLLEVEGRKVAVELKRWVASVGNRVVSHTLGGMLHYGAQEAWVVTTSSFTPKAKEMARSTGVRLIDGVQLARWLEGLEEG